jgi:hypothetical protein
MSHFQILIPGILSDIREFQFTCFARFDVVKNMHIEYNRTLLVLFGPVTLFIVNACSSRVSFFSLFTQFRKSVKSDY